MTFKEKDEMLGAAVLDILKAECSPKFKLIPTSHRTLSIFRQDKCSIIDNIKVKLETRDVGNYRDNREEAYGVMVEINIAGTRFATCIETQEAIDLFNAAYRRARENYGENEFEYILKDFVD